ncbi:bifunctional diaminohydroxyphosphoribosylaminopyrimidine deaminase/5-amino-6-(5-phosphoribosylamino)uracil reductase RibD [Zunongwangia sp. HRR-M8]|uniref:bifunctional diaminohydroxyphosphoribosylaminopyrimidine deaminase/5-amino-6-(5-phosphoribosylamino)uracil reductase RibD n=1 Tax=Zunongwangia sp. HRR-M8 TaxID=3015170 RepID=UPI0022DD79B1|nr:bifunctional diaminohydroxyphosphoribosylaminopyrimidine deaminase/5-amino-6-(5-phosphoribosylamino)uracil reductase RibD [Zunongwangia sp. HRR-M8]WBL23987.1 bifunctional diaminohydroxyphosphoribosylaminopyrimidine deaminase/5-amino-6-(5-phosphoribosylamino)uracil reductase RibD [Zunongwangia sp. HRR-M8]
MNIQEKYIKRCLQLAQNGLGSTYPNPMVGSVIVYKDKIIGEGWHQKAGEAHAEVNAVNSVKDPQLLKKSTIYVSLEPCSHFGKTPPCSDLIIAKGIKKVVVATVDPFAEVAGRGIKKLMEAGCDVTLGVLEKEAQNLNKRFFTFHNKKRPYIILKWAQSEDGFIAPYKREDRAPVWISNRYSKQLVHKWRAEEQSILVGTKTAIDDNPKLNTRLHVGNDPVRVVIDGSGKIPTDSAIFDGSIKTIVITESSPEKSPKNVEYRQADFSQNLPQQIGKILFQENLQSVIIEGGLQTLQSFIDAELWDEARVFTGNLQLKEGILAPKFQGKLISEENIEDNILKTYLND